MTLNEILRFKGNQVHSIRPDATLEEVVNRLVQHNCGSLMVCTEPHCAKVLGIITERDILRAMASAGGRPLKELRVTDHMTRELVTGSPEDTIEHTMAQMTNHRVRHLPVLSGGKLQGIISIGDIVKSQLDQLSMENHYLKSYIQGDVESSSLELLAGKPK